MGRTARSICESGLYHLTARGVGRQLIFEDDDDRENFLGLMVDHLLSNGVRMIAWCLMDNHFHLLVQGEMSIISNSMRVTLSSYALRFNIRHGRCGHLFQDRFASQCVQDEQQLVISTSIPSRLDSPKDCITGGAAMGNTLTIETRGYAIRR